MKKKFRRKYWVNLAWIKDGEREQYLYETEAECKFVTDPGDYEEIRRIEVREL